MASLDDSALTEETRVPPSLGNRERGPFFPLLRDADGREQYATALRAELLAVVQRRARARQLRDLRASASGPELAEVLIEQSSSARSSRDRTSGILDIPQEPAGLFRHFWK